MHRLLGGPHTSRDERPLPPVLPLPTACVVHVMFNMAVRWMSASIPAPIHLSHDEATESIVFIPRTKVDNGFCLTAAVPELKDK